MSNLIRGIFSLLLLVVACGVCGGIQEQDRRDARQVLPEFPPPAVRMWVPPEPDRMMLLNHTRASVLRQYSSGSPSLSRLAQVRP